MGNGIYLTTEETAEFERLTDRAIRLRIEAGNYNKIQTSILSNGIRKYFIHFSELTPEAQIRYYKSKYGGNESRSESDFLDDGRRAVLVNRKIICERAMSPEGVRKGEWIAKIAKQSDISSRTLYRWLGEYQKQRSPMAFARKKRSDIGELRSWDDEVMEMAIGFFLKKGRRLTVKEIYYRVSMQAEAMGAKIGSLRSLQRIIKELPDKLDIYRRRGRRGLDTEVGPPVLRDYSDLEANEFWVGDQHRFNFFVLDPADDRIFRPTGYLWQDLKTRGVSGVAMDEDYNRFTIGKALRMGIVDDDDNLGIYGIPGSVYTDWGKPELSNYLTAGGLLDIKVRSNDAEFQMWFENAFEKEYRGIYSELDVNQIRAIVRNSQAKLIERTFQEIERGLLAKGIPGWSGNRVGSLEDPDKDELKLIRKQKSYIKIDEFWQFVLEVVKKYNNTSHGGRGMRGMSPVETFQTCLNNGYEPATITKISADILFLMPAQRKVSKIGIRINNEQYYDAKLVDLIGRNVEVRYDPADRTFIQVFYKNKFICTATPYIYSSMKDPALTRERIEFKRKIIKDVMTEINEKISKADKIILPGERIQKTRFDRAAEQQQKERRIKRENKKQKEDSWAWIEKKLGTN